VKLKETKIAGYFSAKTSLQAHLLFLLIPTLEKEEIKITKISIVSNFSISLSSEGKKGKILKSVSKLTLSIFLLIARRKFNFTFTGFCRNSLFSLSVFLLFALAWPTSNKRKRE
jgi:hypothetical protein